MRDLPHKVGNFPLALGINNLPGNKNFITLPTEKQT